MRRRVGHVKDVKGIDAVQPAMEAVKKTRALQTRLYICGVGTREKVGGTGREGRAESMLVGR